MSIHFRITLFPPSKFPDIEYASGVNGSIFFDEPPMSDVLVVDDDETTRHLLMLLLRGRGHTVACADSGPEALAYLANDMPRVVVLDVMMPGMDGLTVLRTIRQED